MRFLITTIGKSVKKPLSQFYADWEHFIKHTGYEPDEKFEIKNLRVREEWVYVGDNYKHIVKRTR